MRPMQVATNEFGCRDTSYRNLYIEPFVIYAPNTFTPDGNEFNNEFNPVYADETFEVYNWELRIFNRWGETIFSKSGSSDLQWDGKSNGLRVPQDSYAWVVQYKAVDFPEKGIQTIRGAVIVAY
jgi:gliding motility-associated-like protein